ncbi:Peptidase M23 [Paenibacillus algicola]|uniref:Peptidase M23 n=1 Tax=Paenibacillus algicola TaxID=2565926 RepID=A0A4P8XQR8_9BACL|nr:M23 family metallopeptidase [Paenibacillus algicola]QCT04873.1 Peptidase M23 [Paenibacillus algicola]
MKRFQIFKWVQRLQDRLKTSSAPSEGLQEQHGPPVSKAKPDNSAATPASSSKRRKLKVIYITAGILLAAGGAFLGGREYVNANTVPFYQVYVHGDLVGAINSDDELEKLLGLKQQYYDEKYPGVDMVLHTDAITTRMERDYKPEIHAEETLAKLDGMLKAYARGVELKLDGQTVAIVKDQAAAQAVLEAAKAKYAPAANAAKEKAGSSAKAALPLQKTSAGSSAANASVSIMEEFSVSGVKADPNKVLDVKAAVAALTTAKEQPITYTVREGDTVSSIAQAHSMSSQEVFQLNPGLEEKYVGIGMELKLTSPKAPLTVRTVETVTEDMPSKPETIVRTSDELPLGKRKVVRPGRDGVKEVSYIVTKENGEVVSKQWVSQEVTEPALPEVVYKGTKVEKKTVAAASASSSKMFAWPVSGARITSAYGPRWGSKHEGIDLVGGSTIMASAPGKVIFAGTQGSYGKAVLIDHGNGYQTLYGHLSSISVSVGQSVRQGGKVGIMGSTGRSTGVHLHFEIRKNGNQLNPMQYL